MRKQVKLSIFYPYSSKKVWQALTDSRILSVWMMNNDFEPRLGHKFKFESKSLPGINTVIHCEVVELKELKRLVYTWQDEATSEPSLVIWTLTSVEGGTQLQLKHQHTGYATTLVLDQSKDFREIGDRFANDLHHPGLFLYEQPITNFERQIPQKVSRQQMMRDDLNFLLDCRDSRENWDYFLSHKLPQTLQLNC